MKWHILILNIFLASLEAQPSSALPSELDRAHEALDHNQVLMAVEIAEEVLARNAANVEAWIVLGKGLSAQIDDAHIFKRQTWHGAASRRTKGRCFYSPAISKLITRSLNSIVRRQLLWVEDDPNALMSHLVTAISSNVRTL